MLVVISLLSVTANADFRYSGPITFEQAKVIAAELEAKLVKIDSDAEAEGNEYSIEYRSKVTNVRAAYEKELSEKREACADLPVLEIEQCLKVSDGQHQRKLELLRPTVDDLSQKNRNIGERMKNRRANVGEQFEQVILALHADKLNEAAKLLDECKIPGKVEIKKVGIDRPWGVDSESYLGQLDKKLSSQVEAELKRYKYSFGTVGLFGSYVSLYKRSDEVGCSRENVLATRTFALLVLSNYFNDYPLRTAKELRAFLETSEEKFRADYAKRVKITEIGRREVRF